VFFAIDPILGELCELLDRCDDGWVLLQLAMLSQKLSFHLQHIGLLQVPHIFELFENKLEPGIDYLYWYGFCTLCVDVFFVEEEEEEEHEIIYAMVC
jgi:hypothetical protein